MPAASSLRVLFRAPAGPRRGFGHLVRCRSLARALRVVPVMAIRGGAHALAAARRLGCEVVTGAPAQVIARVAPHVVVVDDPVSRDARRWIACARRAGCRVVTVHDLGLGAPDGDLVVDGSITRAATSRQGHALRGPRFAVLDPAFGSRPRAIPQNAIPQDAVRQNAVPQNGVCRDGMRRVLIALGGGPRIALALAIARAITRACPGADVRVAGGFAVPRGPRDTEVTWTGPLDGLKRELARCDVAVVGGGVSLYEACACGVAAVAVPVVAGQRPTVRGFLSSGAARGSASSATAAHIARDVVRLLTDHDMRRRVAARGARTVDGRGALRVADALKRLVPGAERRAS